MPLDQEFGAVCVLSKFTLAFHSILQLGCSCSLLKCLLGRCWVTWLLIFLEWRSRLQGLTGSWHAFHSDMGKWRHKKIGIMGTYFPASAFSSKPSSIPISEDEILAYHYLRVVAEQSGAKLPIIYHFNI